MTKEFKTKATPLMVLLNDRKAWTAPQHEKPSLDVKTRAEIDRAVNRYAEAHASDPWAAARIRHHLLQGYITPRQVHADLDRITPS